MEAMSFGKNNFALSPKSTVFPSETLAKVDMDSFDIGIASEKGKKKGQTTSA
jgi:hypothetical protein